MKCVEYFRYCWYFFFQFGAIMNKADKNTFVCNPGLSVSTFLCISYITIFNEFSIPLGFEVFLPLTQ